MNLKVDGWLHSFAKKSSQTVAHYAVRLDQDSGLGHDLTRCVLLPMHRELPEGGQPGREGLEGHGPRF